MVNNERRIDNGRRVKKDRRQSGSGMISAYANHNGPERRSGITRRIESERRELLSA